MKNTAHSRKPRNPMVVAALFRRAGAHGPSKSAQRQSGRLTVRQALRELREQHPPSP